MGIPGLEMSPLLVCRSSDPRGYPSPMLRLVETNDSCGDVGGAYYDAAGAQADDCARRTALALAHDHAIDLARVSQMVLARYSAEQADGASV